MKRTTKGSGLPRASAIDQTNLFGREPGAGDVGPATRRSHPITSHNAAKKAANKLTIKQLAVLSLMQDVARPQTHDEIVMNYRACRNSPSKYTVESTAWYPNMTDSSIRTRVSELRALGYVTENDEPGMSAGGSPAKKWALTFAGITANVANLRPVE